MYIEFVDHRPRSTTPSADTKLKTSTKVFTFYLCVFRCVIILASDPNTLLPSLHPLVTTHLRVPMPYRCRFFLPTTWITRARTTIERDPESGKSGKEKGGGGGEKSITSKLDPGAGQRWASFGRRDLESIRVRSMKRNDAKATIRATLERGGE